MSAGGGSRQSSSRPALSVHVEAYLDKLAAEGAARNTIDSYRRDLRLFSAFIEARRRAPEDATQAMIRQYLKSLSEAGMAPGTSARRLSVLRQFFRFLYGERVRDDDPTAALDSPRQGKRIPKYLSESEVEEMRKDAESHAEEDKKKRELIDARNQADQIAYQTEKTLKEHGEKVPAEERSKVESAISNLKEVAKTDDAGAIKKAIENVMTASQALGNR